MLKSFAWVVVALVSDTCNMGAEVGLAVSFTALLNFFLLAH
jgi:hypothetical protein